MLGVHLPGTDMMATAMTARELGLQSYQLFLGSPRRAEVAARMNGQLKTFMPGLFGAVHGPFVINLVANDGKKARMSLGILMGVWREANRVGADALVVHAGSGDSWEPLCGVYEWFSRKAAKGTRLFIENDCGSKKGTRVGSVVNLARARKAVGRGPDGKWIMGIVYDTTHAYANGELLSLEGLKLLSPDMIHLNEPDANVLPGGHLDRHKTVFGEGKLGLEYLAQVATLGIEMKIPVIIEQDLETATESLRRLRVELRRLDGQGAGRVDTEREG